AAGVDAPKREQKIRTWLRPDEYTKLLSLAGGNPRDFAILQVFLQTGIRIAELCDLTLADVDLEAKLLRVRAKGQVEREIPLERKGIQALRNYLKARPEDTLSDSLFLNKT